MEINRKKKKKIKTVTMKKLIAIFRKKFTYKTKNFYTIN